MKQRHALIIAGALGLLGVALGAFGAHGLAGRPGIDAKALEWWDTAARYQQIHAVALLVIAWASGEWSRARKIAAVAMTVGVVVFSGTLYAMALGGPRLLGAVTPLGGLGMLVGWACVIVHAVRAHAR